MKKNEVKKDVVKESYIVKTRKELTEKIVENIKKIGVAWKPEWNKEALNSKNPISGTKYSGKNRLNLAIKAYENNYSDPRWVTFKQAKEREYKIKKGSKGEKIEFWNYKDISITEKNIEKLKNYKADLELGSKLNMPVGRVYNVFNTSQIEGIEPYSPPFKIRTDDEVEKVIKLLKQSSKCEIRETANPNAFYSTKDDVINMPRKDTFNSSQEYLGTLIHEMGHSTKHPDRLNREYSKNTVDCAKEELRAELASVFVQAELGLDLPSKALDQHSAYLKSWANEVNTDKEYNIISQESNQASKISDFLVKNYMVELEKNKNQEIKVIKENLNEKSSNILEKALEENLNNQPTGYKNKVKRKTKNKDQGIER